MHSAVLPTTASHARQVRDDGFAIVPQVYASEEVSAMVESLALALAMPGAAVLKRGEQACAARNLVQFWPDVQVVWRRDPLLELLRSVLGPRFGLVRALYFDKPPGEGWTLPWHKDLTIAVTDNRLTSREFRRPTTKAGVPHVEASRTVLESMLIARIHLDDVTEANGPVRIVPGSHRTGKTLAIDQSGSIPVLAQRGDVLLIRPLVAHNSGAPHLDNRSHRRTLHLEFAAEPDLPDGFTWHDFIADESR